MNHTATRNLLTGWIGRFSLLLAAALCLADAGAAEQKLFFWKVSSGKATVYLLGSIHVAKAGIYPLNPKMEKAFSEADTLVVEANVLENSPELAAKIQMKARYPAGESLDQHVSKELLERTLKRLGPMGISREHILSMKPWYVGMVMVLSELARLGVVPQNGIDVHFLKQVKGTQAIVELEGAEAQINMLGLLDTVEAEQFLQYTEKDLDNLAQSFEEMITAWNEGDADKLASLLLRSVAENPQFQTVFRILFDDRNKSMAAKIEAYLQTEGTFFVVVGAGHLVGDNGIIRLLAPRFTIEQVGR